MGWAQFMIPTRYTLHASPTCRGWAQHQSDLFRIWIESFIEQSEHGNELHHFTNHELQQSQHVLKYLQFYQGTKCKHIAQKHESQWPQRHQTLCLSGTSIDFHRFRFRKETNPFDVDIWGKWYMIPIWYWSYLKHSLNVHCARHCGNLRATLATHKGDSRQ